MSLANKKRPSRLTSTSQGTAETPQHPVKSPVEKRSARFTLFRKRTSTSTSSASTNNGSFSSLPVDATPTVFQTFSRNQEDDEFGYSNDHGKIATLPKKSELRVPDDLIGPRVSDLRSKTGVPIFIGKAIEDLPPASPAKTSRGVPSSPKPAKSTDAEKGTLPKTSQFHVKQSYQSRHKVPDVVRKIIQGEDPTMYEWPSAPAYSMVEQTDRIPSSQDEQLDDFLDIPPPPPVQE